MATSQQPCTSAPSTATSSRHSRPSSSMASLRLTWRTTFAQVYARWRKMMGPSAGTCVPKKLSVHSCASPSTSPGRACRTIISLSPRSSSAGAGVTLGPSGTSHGEEKVRAGELHRAGRRTTAPWPVDHELASGSSMIASSAIAARRIFMAGHLPGFDPPSLPRGRNGHRAGQCGVLGALRGAWLVASVPQCACSLFLVPQSSVRPACLLWVRACTPVSLPRARSLDEIT